MQDATQRSFTFTPSARQYDAPNYSEIKIPRSVPEKNSSNRGSFFTRLVIAMLLFCGLLLARNSTSADIQTFTAAVGKSFSAEYTIPKNGIFSYITEKAAFSSIDYPQMAVPTNGTVVCSFGENTNNGSTCLGIIVEADTQENIYASLAGTVLSTEESEMLGKYIVVESENGIRVIYGCLGEILVEPQDEISQGMQLATMSIGNSGKYYLYFEVQQNEHAIDPQKCFAQPGKNA